MRLPRQLFVAALLTPALLSGCGGGVDDAESESTATETFEPAATGTPTPTATGSSTPLAENLREVAVGGGPVGLAVQGGRVWVVDAVDSTLNALTPQLDMVGTSVSDIVRTPLRLAPLKGVLWVTSFGDGRLVGVAVRDQAVRTVVKVGKEPEGVAVLRGSVWVVLQSDGQLVEVDPDAGKVLRRVDVGVRPRQVTAAYDWLWVSDFPGGDVFAVDPISLDVAEARNICSGPQAMAPAGGLLWVSCTDSGEVVGLDPIKLDVVRRVTGLDHPDGLAVDGADRLLVALQAGPQVAAVDPSNGSVITTVSLGDSEPLDDRANIDIEVVGDTLVVSSFLDGKVLVADVP